MKHAPAPCPIPPTEAELFVIESDARAFRSLAAIAPGLTDTELRVALHLASIANPINQTASASSRQIADSTGVERKNIQRALDSLARRYLIATRQGSGKTPSHYRLNFTQTTALPSGVMVTPLTPPSGVTATPPTPPSGVTATPPTPPSGVTVTPHAQATFDLQAPQAPQVASQRRHPSGPQEPLDIDIDTSDSIIDRVLTARPQHLQTSELDQVRRFAYKWLTLQRGKDNAQPPDGQVCARIAAAAGGASHACDWIRDHLQDRQADNCEYLVVWMLQQLHGYAPPAIKRRRAELRALAGGKPTSSEPQADTDARQFTAELLSQAVAKTGNLR